MISPCAFRLRERRRRPSGRHIRRAAGFTSLARGCDPEAKVSLYESSAGAAQEGRVCRILHGGMVGRGRVHRLPKTERTQRDGTPRTPTDSSSRLPVVAGPTGSGTAPLPLNEPANTRSPTRFSSSTSFSWMSSTPTRNAGMRHVTTRSSRRLARRVETSASTARFCGTTALAQLPSRRQCPPRNRRIRSTPLGGLIPTEAVPMVIQIVENVSPLILELFFLFFPVNPESTELSRRQ